MDRRFVSYYFNRSGNGEGGNEAATKFVNGQTDNPYAYFAAFKPTGELVGETEIYADKDAVMQWLQNLLRRYPEYAKPTGAESGVLAAGGLAAAQLAENLADYAKAKAGYDGLLESEDVGVRTAALLGLLRIYRYQEDWDQHEVVQKLLRWAVEGGADKSLLVDLSVEKGYRLIASNKFAEARSVLQALAFRAKDSSRLAEAHFLAGRACWFVDDHDWAKFHWCWIVDNLPEDRLYMRARIAAAAEGMPYPNAELDGFAAKVGNIGTHSIVTAVAAAKEVYRQLQPSFEAKKFTAELQEIVAAAPALDAKVGKIGEDVSLLLLVSKLRDGNEYVPANNRIVDTLEKAGAAAIPSLVAAIEDVAFPGRGYSAWALTQVLKAGGIEHEQAMRVLQKALRDSDPYVVVLTRSGLSTLPGK